ncbi:MAG TPA: hypothetical protein PLX15_05470 [Candidatus Woesearchaeota archaeon]|nr:hypothetical protein [Candidatus Woesearchaeota archaeon]
MKKPEIKQRASVDSGTKYFFLSVFTILMTILLTSVPLSQFVFAQGDEMNYSDTNLESLESLETIEDQTLNNTNLQTLDDSNNNNEEDSDSDSNSFFSIESIEDVEENIIIPKKYGAFNRFFDNLALTFTFNQEKRAIKALEIADKKISNILNDLETKETNQDFSKDYQKTIQTFENALQKIENNGNIENSKNTLSNLSKIEQRVQTHYQKVATVKEIILERQRERMTPNQIEHLEGVFGKITNRYEAMENKFNEKRENTILKYKALSGKDDNQIAQEIETMNSNTGLTQSRKEMAKWQLSLADSSLKMSKERFQNFLDTIENQENQEIIQGIKNQLDDLQQLLKTAIKNLEENDYESAIALGQEIKAVGDELNIMILSLRESNTELKDLLESKKSQIDSKRIELIQEILEKVPVESKERILESIQNIKNQREQNENRVNQNNNLENSHTTNKLMIETRNRPSKDLEN